MFHHRAVSLQLVELNSTDIESTVACLHTAMFLYVKIPHFRGENSIFART